METKSNTLPQPSNQQSNKNSINPELNNIPFKFLRNRLSEKKQDGYNSGSENDILNKNSNSLPPAPPVLNKMKKSNSENRFDISDI